MSTILDSTIYLLRWISICIILLTPILWIFVSAFRYYVKMGVYYVLIFVNAHICFFLTVPFYGDLSNYKTIAKVFLFLTRIFNIKWEARGKEHLKSDTPFVAICNHQSSLDFMGMMELWPDRCVAVAKNSLKYAGLFGITGMAAGTVFIERYNREKAIESVNKTIQEIKRKQVKVWIFPEGTRHHEEGMLPFKKGAFHMAVQAQVTFCVEKILLKIVQIPIVPVVFSSYSFFYSKRDKRFLSKGFVIAQVLPPISTKGLTANDVTDLSVKAREQMLAVYEKISPEATERFERGQF